MKLYLAGPMRGLPDENRAAFDKAAAALRAAGHEVLVPHEHDDLFPGGTLRQKFARTVAWLCAYAEGMATLDGWHASLGTQGEVSCARALDIPVKGWKEWL